VADWEVLAAGVPMLMSDIRAAKSTGTVNAVIAAAAAANVVGVPSHDQENANVQDQERRVVADPDLVHAIVVNVRDRVINVAVLGRVIANAAIGIAVKGIVVKAKAMTNGVRLGSRTSQKMAAEISTVKMAMLTMVGSMLKSRRNRTKITSLLIVPMGPIEGVSTWASTN